MYGEKIEQILSDLEDKNIEIAGGSVIGIINATINSLIKYISNLTLGKKKYENVQKEVEDILEKAEKLRSKAIDVVDKDKEILEDILKTYKQKGEATEKYIESCKNGVDFCMQVVELSFQTLKLSDEISKVGNKMLESDFKICKFYSFASIQASIVNVDINLQSVEDEKYKENIVNKCKNILESAEKYM